MGARTLRARVRDNCDEGYRFTTQRGFGVWKHSIEMMFDLKSWDESRYCTYPAVASGTGIPLHQHG